jgi:hypothetical protein
MNRTPKWIQLGSVILLITLGSYSTAWGGTFIASLGSGSSLNNQDFIMHPKGYAGSGDDMHMDDVSVHWFRID